MSFGIEAKRGKYVRKSCPKLVLPIFSHFLLQIRNTGSFLPSVLNLKLYGRFGFLIGGPFEMFRNSKNWDNLPS